MFLHLLSAVSICTCPQSLTERHGRTRGGCSRVQAKTTRGAPATGRVWNRQARQPVQAATDEALQGEARGSSGGGGGRCSVEGEWHRRCECAKGTNGQAFALGQMKSASKALVRPAALLPSAASDSAVPRSDRHDQGSGFNFGMKRN